MEANIKIGSIKLLIRKVEELQLLATSIGIDSGIINDVMGNNVIVEPSFIVNMVQERLKIDVSQKVRKRDIVDGRRIICFLLRRYSKLSLKNIAPYANIHDHTGVIHHIKTVEGFLENDDRTIALISEFESKIIEHYEKKKNEDYNI